MTRSIFKPFYKWLRGEKNEQEVVDAELARLRAEEECGIDKGVRAIAASFYEPERWAEVVPSPGGIGTRAWRDVVTYRVVILQSLPDPLPFSEPDLSAEWLPDSEFEVLHYLTREWKRAQAVHRQRHSRERREQEKAEFLRAKEDFLKDHGE